MSPAMRPLVNEQVLTSRGMARRRVHPLVGVLAGVLIAAVFIAFFLSLYRTPDTAVEVKPHAVLHVPGESEKRLVSLPFYDNSSRNRGFRAGEYRLDLELDVPSGLLASGVPAALVFPYIGGNAMSLKLNGQWLGSTGEMVSARSSIWNAVKVFRIPPGVLAGQNTVEVILRGTYEAGIIKIPYLVDTNVHAVRLLLLRFVSDSAIWYLCGAIMILGITVGIMGLACMPDLDPRLILGIACVASAVFMTDFLKFEYLPLPLIAFKKLVVVLRHVSGVLFTLGILRLMSRKIDLYARIFIGVQVVCILAILFVPKTIQNLKWLYDRTYLTFLPFPVYLFFLMVVERKSAAGHLAVLFGATVGVCAAMRDGLAAFLWPHTVLISHYGFMVLVLSVSAYVVIDMAERNRQLVLETRRALRYREASMHDPLTGVFNRNALSILEEGIAGPVAVLVADVDDLKHLNDRFGHAFGDRVLQDFSSILKRISHPGDTVIRSGGDEFLLLLHRCDKNIMDSFITRIKYEASCSRLVAESFCPEQESLSIQGNGYSQTPGPGAHKEQIVGYSVSIGAAYQSGALTLDVAGFRSLVSLADSEMYLDKRRNKHQV